MTKNPGPDEKPSDSALWLVSVAVWVATPVAQTAAFVVQVAGPVAGMAGGVAALFRPEAGPCFFKGRFFLREAGTKGRSLWHVAFFAALDYA